MNFHTQRITSAVALAPPSPGMYLVGVLVTGGATPGSVSIRYNGVASAHFPAPTSGQHYYDVSEKLSGTNIPAGSIGFNGGIASAVFTYSTEANGKGKPLSAFRAVRVTRTTTGTGTATYDEQPAAPKFAVVLTSVAGRVAFPAVGPYTQTIEAWIEETVPPALPVTVLAPANTHDLTFTLDGAGTTDAYLFY